MTLRSEILKAMDDNGYLQPILQLDRLLAHTGWFIGGWLRSLLSGRKNYIGDIDIATTLREKAITERLEFFGHQYSRNSSGGFRINLKDGNTIDILPIEHLSRDNDILDALGNFNFSVNSVAVKISEDNVLATDTFKQDIVDRRLRVNLGFNCKDNQYRGFFKDIQFLIAYDGLAPGHDHTTKAWIAKVVMAERTRSAMNSTDLLKSIVPKVVSVVPDGYDAWIVRGFVRSALHCESKIWDDIDIVTMAHPEEIERRLQEQSLKYTYNLFGTPKVTCPDGTVVDIWSMNPRGLAAELSAYSHSVDAVSWSLRNDEFQDPLSVIPQIDARTISIQESFLKSASTLQLSYATLKALYLCIRHRYTPSASVIKLLSEPILTTPLIRKNAIRLAKELSTIYGLAYLNDLASGQVMAGTAMSVLASAIA